MNTRVQPMTILLAAVLTISFAPDSLLSQDVKSIKPGKTYTSPLKDFEVTAPELCLGTKIQQQSDKNGGMVAFLSDVGQLDRIDFARLDPDVSTSLSESTSEVKQAVYAEHLRSTVLEPNEGTIITAEPLVLDETEVLFAVAELPGGSVLESVSFREGEMVSERMDSVRGLVVFAREDVIYVLHHEVGVDFDAIWDCGLSGMGGPQLTADERDRAAREGLQRLYEAMRFK